VSALKALTVFLTLSATYLQFGQSVAQQIEPTDADGSKMLRRVLSSSRPPTRIIGGHNAMFADNPWQVALLAAARASNADAQFCGGSTVAPRWVLTAAHCVDNRTKPGQLAVLTGTESLVSGGRRVPVAPGGVIVHEQWDPSTNENDIALLHVTGDLDGVAIQAVDGSQVPAVSKVRVSGWGAVSIDYLRTTNLLQAVEVDNISPAVCGSPLSYGDRLKAHMICAGQQGGGADACAYDSGGPETVELSGKRLLLGIVSWGDSCGLPNKYGIYTQVSDFKTWIKQKSNGEVSW